MPPEPTPAGIAIIAEFEKNQMTLDTSSWNTSVGNFKFASAIWMLAFDTVLYVLRVFLLCALVPRVQGSSGAVATVQFVWRGHAKTLTTRAGPWPDFALRLE